MSRSNKPRGWYRRIVKGKYIQSILMRYGEDIGSKHKKIREFSRLVRKREKRRISQEIRNDYYE